MKIKLLAHNPSEIVDRILSGELPPETGDKEVIQELGRRVADNGFDIKFWRYDETGYEIVEYRSELVAQFADTRHWPDPRP